MAYEFYTPGQAFQPEWAQSWTPSAFRKLMEDVGFKPGNMSASELRDGGDMNIRNKFYDYLNSQGMKLGLDSGGQYGKYQVFDNSGKPVGAGEDFNSGGMELLTPLLLAGGVAGLQALGGLGGGAAAAGEGVGTLGAGGSAAGGFTASPLTGLGASGGLTTGAASIPTLAELGFGSGSLDALLGAGAGAGSGIGTLGAGGSPVTPFTPDPISPLGANGGLSQAATSLSGLPSQYAPRGLEKLIEQGAKSAASNSIQNQLKDAVSNPLVKYGLTGLGALAGAKDAGSGSQASVQSKMDPRMDQYVYGNGYGDPNSLLGAALAQFKANPTGINPLMQQGLDMAKSALTDPAYSQTYTNMRNLGNGLLNMQVAGNPFTQGRQLPQAGLLGNGNTGIVPPPDVGVPTMKALPYMGGKGLL